MEWYTDELDRASAAVRKNPWRLPRLAAKIGRRVHAGDLDHGAAWDALWLAATAAGLGHLTAQRVIGQGFAKARRAA